MIRILLADDHQLFREALKSLLGNSGDLEVVAEASTGEEALDRALREEPDVVVLDVSMPGRGGLETVAELKRRLPTTRVLILTVHPEERFAVRSLRGGADGYLTKDAAAAELIGAIRRIHSGRKFITPELAENLALYVERGDSGTPHEVLSDREFQVLRMLAMAKTVSEIGEELHLSVKTISTYRSRLLEKLGLRNNAEIMQYAVRHGLVDIAGGPADG